MLHVSTARPLDEDRLLALRSLALAAGARSTAAALHETVRAESRRDALTGLYNRRSSRRTCRRRSSAGRPRGVRATVGADARHRPLQALQRHPGHRAGDPLLTRVGRAASVDAASDGQRLPLRRRGVRAAAARRRRGGGRPARRAGALGGRAAHRVTVSLGTVTARADVGPDRLVEAADTALYAAKSDGRNRLCTGALDDGVGGCPPPSRRGLSTSQDSATDRTTPPLDTDSRELPGSNHTARPAAARPWARTSAGAVISPRRGSTTSSR